MRRIRSKSALEIGTNAPHSLHAQGWCSGGGTTEGTYQTSGWFQLCLEIHIIQCARCIFGWQAPTARGALELLALIVILTRVRARLPRACRAPPAGVSQLSATATIAEIDPPEDEETAHPTCPPQMQGKMVLNHCGCPQPGWVGPPPASAGASLCSTWKGGAGRVITPSGALHTLFE
jgi:hypothetical protein